MSDRCVLIVDDSLVSRVILRKYIALIRPGWLCVEVCSGEDALVVVESLRFDFAIVDVNLQGIDGLDTASSLKRVQPHLVVSMVTADVRGVVRERAIGLEAHVVEKPISKEKARSIIALLEAGAEVAR